MRMTMKKIAAVSVDRRKFFATLTIGALAAATGAINPLRLFTGKKNPLIPARPSVTITPNPMAVQRTIKDTTHNG